MTYPEPLTPHVVRAGRPDGDDFAIVVRDGTNQSIAAVRCNVDRRTRCGYFGAMEILDDAGSPRQKARAMVLLTRAALAHAAELDIRRVMTDVPADRETLVDFARRMAGVPGTQRSRSVRIIGDLADIRSNVLNRTDDAGEERTR